MTVIVLYKGPRSETGLNVERMDGVTRMEAGEGFLTVELDGWSKPRPFADITSIQIVPYNTQRPTKEGPSGIDQQKEPGDA